jgi:hypothetical protein
MSEAHHPIHLAARLTGLSTHVIRIWEQRYQVVEPKRTPTNCLAATRTEHLPFSTRALL